LREGVTDADPPFVIVKLAAVVDVVVSKMPDEALALSNEIVDGVLEKLE
jgi:hypothetical protein